MPSVDTPFSSASLRAAGEQRLRQERGGRRGSGLAGAGARQRRCGRLGSGGRGLGAGGAFGDHAQHGADLRRLAFSDLDLGQRAGGGAN